MRRHTTLAAPFACLLAFALVHCAYGAPEHLAMPASTRTTASDTQHLLPDAVNAFHQYIGRFDGHGVAPSNDDPSEFYLQPGVYLSLHLVQMREAGWDDVDYDLLAAVSGSSALFGYQPDDFMPKYANLHIGMDDRIADATGFGYEWIPFEGIEGAWDVVVESVDAGKSVKGWDWENILFAGYENADDPSDRRVYAMADGPGTYSRWFTWAEFGDWVTRMGEWGLTKFGRHTARVATKPEAEIARRVLADLVEWSDNTPAHVVEKYPKATFGLAGIELYAEHCADMEKFEDFGSCHDINPLWCLRNSTASYLRRVVEADMFPEATDAALSVAANEYRSAYLYWKQFGLHLTHGSPEDSGKSEEHRAEGASALRKALAHEKAALAALEPVVEAAN